MYLYDIKLLKSTVRAAIEISSHTLTSKIKIKILIYIIKDESHTIKELIFIIRRIKRSC